MEKKPTQHKASQVSVPETTIDKLEVSLGEFEVESKPLKSLIRLSQVRDGLNPKVEKIKESIERRLENPHTMRKALIHPISVAQLDKDTFDEYVGAINSIWGSNHIIDNYECDENGWYYLVVAGHTRTEAAESIEKEQDVTITMPCVISENLSIEEIIATQLDENTYEAPSPERRAMAMAEYYYYGVGKKLWDNPLEFRKSIGNKFDKASLEQALNFAALPQSIREFVFIDKNKLPYSVAVELGATMPTVDEYFRERFKDDFINLTEAQIEMELDATKEKWLGIQVAHIQNEKMTASTAKKYLIGLASDLSADIDVQRSGMTLDLQMSSSGQSMVKLHQRELNREYVSILREMTEEKLSKLSKALQLHIELCDDHGGFSGELKQRVERTIGSIGSVAIQGA